MGLKACLAVLMVTLIFLSDPSSAATHIQFVYLNASEDGAGGGHAALKMDDEVFHFEHVPPGLLKIKRDDFAHFRDQYLARENRTMEMHHVAVSEETKILLREHFNRVLLIEDEQFDRREALENDGRLLKALLQLSRHDAINHGKTNRLELKGAGFFLPDDWQFNASILSTQPEFSEPSIDRLRCLVIAEYGNNFLRSKIRETFSNLQTLKPVAYESFGNSLAEDRFQSSEYTFSKQYSDYMGILAALYVLQQGLPLHESLLVQSDREEFRLSGKERLSVVAYRNWLEGQLVRLVGQNHPDWGFALLLGMARLIVLEQSLVSGHWVMLNLQYAEGSKQGNPSNLTDATFKEYASSRARFSEAKSALMGAATPSEWDYLHLEKTTNQFIELGNALREGRAANLVGMKSLPSRPASIVLIPSALTSDELQTSLDRLEGFRSGYEENLTQLYSYNLLGRNCASEIFRIIGLAMREASKHKTSQPGQTFTDQTAEVESTARLGGYISGKGWEFIPFVSSLRVEDTWRIAFSEQVLSYRLQKLEQARQQEASFWLSWRESNVFSSEVYQWHGNDPAFVFFTDDLMLARPLAGGVNLLAGLAQGVSGILTMALDGGENLRLGVKGVMISLPELFFFNIRKGTFPGLVALEE